MGKQRKAGFIPYTFNETIGKFKYLMMVSSNAAFGGSLPMISKGGQDPGETDEETALREAEEELGLVRSNVLNCFDVGKYSSKNYKLVVFAGEIRDPHSFVETCYETAYTVWMTADEFLKFGRKDHHMFIIKLDETLQKQKIT